MENSSTRTDNSRERLEYEKIFLNRSKMYRDKGMKVEEGMRAEITLKLQNLLGGRYTLDKDDYIILIDKFKLDKPSLDKHVIAELVKFLNIQEQYKEKPKTKAKAKTKAASRDMNLKLKQLIASNKKELIRNNDDIPNTELLSAIDPASPVAADIEIYSNKEQSNSESDAIEQAPRVTMQSPPPQPTYKNNILVIDLLKHDQVDDHFKIPLKNKYLYKNIHSITLEDIIISDNMVDKLTTYPYILMRIEPLNNTLRFNCSQKTYFSYFKINDTSMLKAKEYIPTFELSLEYLTVTLYSHQEESIALLDIDDGDYIQFIFNIKTISSLELRL